MADSTFDQLLGQSIEATSRRLVNACGVIISTNQEPESNLHSSSTSPDD